MHIKLADTKYETCKCHNDTDLQHVLGVALLSWQACLPAGPVIMGLNPHSDADLNKKITQPYRLTQFQTSIKKCSGR